MVANTPSGEGSSWQSNYPYTDVLIPRLAVFSRCCGVGWGLFELGSIDRSALGRSWGTMPRREDRTLSARDVRPVQRFRHKGRQKVRAQTQHHRRYRASAGQKTPLFDQADRFVVERRIGRKTAAQAGRQKQPQAWANRHAAQHRLIDQRKHKAAEHIDQQRRQRPCDDGIRGLIRTAVP